MITAIKKKLGLLYQSILKEFHEAPCKTFAAAIAICSIVLIPTFAALWPKGIFSNHISKILQYNTEVNLSLLILSVGLLAWSVILIKATISKLSVITISSNQILEHKKKLTALESEKERIKNDAAYYSTQSDNLRIDISNLQSQLSESNKSRESEKQASEKLISDNANLRIANNELAEKLHEYENPKPIPLVAKQINILKLLYLHDTMATERIAEMFDLKLQEAKYHLDELKTMNLIKTKTVYHDVEKKLPFGTQYSQQGVLSWTLEQKGRKFLIDNKLT